MAPSSVLWVLALCGLVVLSSAACPDATFSVEHTVQCCDNAYNTGGLFGTPSCCRDDNDDKRCYCKSGASVVGEGCVAGAPAPAPATTTVPPTTAATTSAAVTTAADTTTDAATTAEITTGATTAATITTNAATTTAGAATTLAPSTECQCFCGAAIVPTTTCGAVTTPKLCPEWPMVTARVLGGTPTDECTVDGVLQFRVGDRQMCNGVYVYDTTGPFSQEPAVYMPNFCKESIDTVLTMTPLPAEGKYNVINFDTVNGSDIIDQAAVTDNITALLTTPGLLDSGSCQTPACAYNPATMSTEINLNNCTLTSFGYDNISTGVPTTSDSLNTIAVVPGTQCPPDAPIGTECFVPVDPDVFSCTGDTGAPVYCMLSTGEKVLYGLVDVTTTCGRDQFFNIRPIKV